MRLTLERKRELSIKLSKLYALYGYIKSERAVSRSQYERLTADANGWPEIRIKTKTIPEVYINVEKALLDNLDGPSYGVFEFLFNHHRQIANCRISKDALEMQKSFLSEENNAFDRWATLLINQSLCYMRATIDPTPTIAVVWASCIRNSDPQSVVVDAVPVEYNVKINLAKLMWDASTPRSETTESTACCIGA